jgi:hypothetical protein
VSESDAKRNRKRPQTFDELVDRVIENEQRIDRIEDHVGIKYIGPEGVPTDRPYDDELPNN